MSAVSTPGKNPHEVKSFYDHKLAITKTWRDIERFDYRIVPDQRVVEIEHRQLDRRASRERQLLEPHERAQRTLAKEVRLMWNNEPYQLSCFC